MDRVGQRIVLGAEQGCRGLLRLYPRPFREQYGAEIVRAFSEMAHEHYRRWGLAGLIRLYLRLLGDTLVAAAREHCERIRERSRQRRGKAPESALMPLLRDVRCALRYLARQPAFSLVVVLTLALGIGANTAIFSVIYAALLRPLPYEDGEKLVSLKHLLPEGEDDDFSLRELEALRQQSLTLLKIAEHHSMSFILLEDSSQEDSGPERVMTGVVSIGFFELLGVEPVLGRVFERGDKHQPVLVLNHDFWLERYAGNPGVVGREVEMNDHVHTIIGVLPSLPAHPGVRDVFMPSTSCPFRQRHLARGDPDNRVTHLIARLAPGVTLAEASAEVEAIIDGANAGVLRPPESKSLGIRLVPLAEEMARRARPTFVVLLATVVFILLVACANTANLTLARLVHRERELAVRAALGAGRGRLVRQLMTESLVLAGLGGILGLALAQEMLGHLARFAARFTARANEIHLDAAALLFTLALVLVTAVLLGMLPALPRWRSLVQTLRYGSWGRFLGYGRQRLQRLLVVVQVAISFVLLTGAGLMVRTFMKLQEVDPGFRPDNVLTLRLDLNWSRYDSPQAYRDFFTDLLDELSDRTSIDSVAVAHTFPLYDLSPLSRRLTIQGRPRDREAPAPSVDFRAVSADYFETLGIEFSQGRGFGCEDDLDSEPVAIVNRSLATRHFGDRDPVGRNISVDEGRTWRTIVGVVGDVKQYGLASDVSDEIYAPLGQHVERDMTLLVRTRDDPQSVARQMWQAVAKIDSEQAVAHLRTLEQIRQDALDPPRLTTVLLGLFAALALALTAAGVSGVLSFFVSQRTHEIGVRMALGASRNAVLRMVLGEGMSLALAGALLGGGGAFFLSRSMSELLFGVEPTDPWTFFVTALLLLAVAAAACYLPARWATSIRPATALRQD